MEDEFKIVLLQVLSSPDLLYRSAGVLGAVSGSLLVAYTFYEGVVKDWLRYRSVKDPVKS